MASFGLTLANRGVIIGAVTVPELFDMAKRGEDSGAFRDHKKSEARRRVHGDFSAPSSGAARATMGKSRCHLRREILACGLPWRSERTEPRTSPRAQSDGHQRHGAGRPARRRNYDSEKVI